MRKTDDETIIKMLQEGKLQKEIARYFGVSPAAICKRVKRLLPVPECLQNLTDKERRFAIEVAGGRNQTQAARASHDCSSMASAKALGYQLMQKSDIKTAIAEIMQQQGLTKTYRVQKLKSHIDHRDPNVSLRALDQSWKLDGAYIDNHRVIVADYREISTDLEEIEKEIATLERRTASDPHDTIDAEIAVLEKEIAADDDAD